MAEPTAPPPAGGLPEMRLSPEFRRELFEHLETLRTSFERQHWGGRVGFGSRPAVIVVDLALGWTDPEGFLGYDMDRVVDATVEILNAAREAKIPVIFTTASEEHVDPTRKGATCDETHPSNATDA